MSSRGTRRRPRRGVLTAGLGAAALVLGGLAAGAVALVEWRGLFDYRSPYLVRVEPGPETPRLTERVILFVVDGLRADVARSLPTFARLGAEGSFLIARTAQPSLSRPGWAALLTGAPPEISEVTTNRHEGPVRADSVLDAAARAGLPTALVGTGGWREMFGDVVGTGRYVPDDDEGVSDPAVGRRALRVLAEADPALLVVHLPDVDRRGHESGVGRAYRRAARRADAIIAEIAASAGPGTTLVLTADHGHLDAGGHGGPEEEVTRTPLVLHGPGLLPGARGEVAQADVAPLVAALLGLPRPAHATGELPAGLLDAAPEQRAAIEEAQASVAARFYERATAAVGGTGDTAAAFGRAREEKTRHDVLARLPLVLLALAALANAVVLATRRLDGVAIAAGTVAFGGALAGLWLARGLSLSFSQFNSEAEIASFLGGRALDGAVAALAGGAATGLVAGARGRRDAFRAGLGTAAWAMLALALGVAAFVVVYGWSFTWRLPDLSAAFAQFMALLTMATVGAVAWAAGLVAAAAARLTAARRG